VTSQEVLSRLLTKVRAFRGTIWFRVVYVIILGALVAELYLLTASPLACLILFLMPLSVFLIPYYFGERRMKHFALNAVPVFIIATLLAGGMATQALLSQAAPVPLQSSPTDAFSSPTMMLSNGTVDPYRSAPDTVFTFRVKLTTTAVGNATDYAVYLNFTIIDGVSATQTFFPLVFSPGANSSANNTKNGTWYAYSARLGSSIYGYAFSATDNRSNWTFTPSDFGPITASGTAFYGFFVYYTGFSMTFPLLFYFVILFMWWYTKRTRETRARLMAGGIDIPKEKVEKEEPKPVEVAGKASKAAAFTCTNCGADVSEDDAKCPKCGAVFEE